MTYKFSEKVSHLQASAIREILKFTSDPEVISFAAGNPSPEAFPVDELNRISEEIFKKNPIGALQYSLTEGYTPLRDLYKIPLTNLLGGTGMGYFASAFSVFTPVFAIVVSGIPSTMARLTAENYALERFSNMRHTKLYRLT